MNKALFLDRDGVINHMVHYKYGWDSPQKTADIKLVGGILEIIIWANRNKILVVEVSNQPGVAKGKMTQRTSDDIESMIHKLLKTRGANIDKIYICPHHPNAVISKYKKACDCRKPKPGLLLRASKELNINLSKSIFVGDKASDAIAGKAACVKTIIYFHKEDADEKIIEAKRIKAYFKAKKIEDVFRKIKSYFKSK